MEYDPMTATELESTRRRLGITQKQMALRLGVNLRTVQRWLSGESRVHPAAVDTIRSWRA